VSPVSNLLRGYAKGQWVEAQVQRQTAEEGVNLDWSRKGVDAVDPATGIKYDIMSGSTSNIAEHAERMSEVLFRYITF
jgi:hypothetical protein